MEHIYLATLSRRPTAKEMEVVNKHVQSLRTERAAGLQDLREFALMNSNEFLLRALGHGRRRGS